MKKYLFSFFLLVTCSAAMQGQNYELGEVTKQELEEKSHPKDPSAPAAVLFSKGETYMSYSERDGFILITEVDMKVKIYNKDGYIWANKNIPYYDAGSEKESVDISKAFTYNLEGGSIKKTKLKGEGEFTEEVNKNWRLRKIVMPDVKEGSIVEYRYKIVSPFITVFPEWKFQHGIPVNYSAYTTRIPEYFGYTPNFRGYFTPKVTKSTKSQSITFTDKQRVENRPSEISTSKIDYIDNIIKYEMQDLPGLKDEAFVNNIENYAASIEHEVTYVKYPNSPIKSFSSTWEDVAKTIYDNEDFGGQLKRTGYFEDDINALLSGISSPEQKVSIIYYYVRERMNWNGNYGYLCDAGVKKAYTEKTGNDAEINLMLTAMLRYANIDANPVLVTTRSAKTALFPSRTAFNYVVTAVNLGDKTVVLDATSKSAVPGILPIRALNWAGRLIKQDGISIPIPMVPSQHSKEASVLTATVASDGQVTGKAQRQYEYYNAYIFRETFSGMSKESCMEKIEKAFAGLEVGAYATQEDKDFTKPVVEEYEFNHNGMDDVIGDKMYIRPMLYLGETENPFKQEKREYPVDFIFPRQEKFIITLKCPEGYHVESVPAGISLAMEEKIGSFKYNIVQLQDQVQVRAMVELNYATVSQDYYTTLKDFFDKMIEKQNEKIVFAKNN
jgi:hypothetical protein